MLLKDFSGFWEVDQGDMQRLESEMKAYEKLEGAFAEIIEDVVDKKFGERPVRWALSAAWGSLFGNFWVASTISPSNLAKWSVGLTW